MPTPHRGLSVRYTRRRFVVRGLPGFVWIQVALRATQWRWTPHGEWAAGLAKVRRLGPLRLITLRTDAAARGITEGRLTPEWVEQ